MGEDQGELNGGETETEKGRDREVAISTRPLPGVSSDATSCAPPERPVKGRPLPVHCPQKPAGGPSSLGLSSVCAQVCGNLLLGPVPKGTSLGGRETKVKILGGD